MYRFLLKPRWILSHIFVLVVVGMMINFGFWQLNRLDERINRLEVRLDERINRLDERINGLDEKINQLRGEFLEFKEEMRLVPVKIAGWVAGAMIGSSGVIFGGFQLLRGLL